MEITLTGGEPLLAFTVMEELVSHAEQRASETGIKISVILKTNGTILTPAILAFIHRHCSKVVISIDGAPRSHNAHRKNTRGDGTHDIVSRNLVALLENGVSCSASVTVHPDVSCKVLDSVPYLHGLGVRQIDVGPAYGTVAWDEAASRALTEALMQVAGFMRDVNRRGAQLEVGPLYRESEHIGGRLNECWGCHAGSTNLAFLPNGQISGCSALAMLATTFPEMIIGDVSSGLDDEALARLLQIAQAGGCERLKCQTCPTRPNCAGGCLAINYSTTGVALAPPDFYCQTISAIPGAWHRAWVNTMPKAAARRRTKPRGRIYDPLRVG